MLFLQREFLVVVLMTLMMPNHGTTRLSGQREMVQEYVNHAVFHSSGFSGARHHASNPASCIPCLLRDLYLRVKRILMCCSSWHADVSFQQCQLIPCGKAANYSEGIFSTTVTLRVPKSFTINVTILEVSSEWDADNCAFTASLRLLTNDLSFPLYFQDSIPICGKSPVQTFYFTSHRLPVLWESPQPQPKNPFFRLSYQAVYPDYVYHNNPTFYNLCISGLRKCPNIPSLSQSELFHLMSWGEKRVYIWYTTGSVLDTPVMQIRDFRCYSINDVRKNEMAGRLSLYDAPFSPRDPNYHGVPIAPLTSFLCSVEGLPEKYTPSVGELTIVIAVEEQIQFRLKAKVTYVRTKCPSTFCSITSAEILPFIWRSFTISPATFTTQKRLLLRPQSSHWSHLVVSELSAEFEGFTHLLCASGGIYIYEVGRYISLIGQICSSLVARAWTGAIQDENGNVRLYLNRRSLLFVVKSYQGRSKGGLSGRALVSDGCVGVVQPPPYYHKKKHNILHRSKENVLFNNIFTVMALDLGSLIHLNCLFTNPSCLMGN